MPKQIKKYILKYKTFLLLFLLSLPAFYRMLRPGIFSTQDFHFFRLVEFDKCVKDLQIPCRWAPDAGLGYGEPIFNYYGQLVYALGETFHLISFSFIASFKLVFIFSIIGSAIGMYLLAKHFWKNEVSAYLATAFYIYAPYRAVDIWVRGILPEAMAFAIFPFLFLQLELFFEKQKRKHLLIFSMLFASLILTHNISVILFLPVLAIWTLYKLINRRNWEILKNLILALILSFLISSFYLLPIVFETKYINLDSTITGYFDFRGHFVTIFQLLFSRFWGYGASVFGPEDGLNLSIGFFQWTIPLIVAIFFLVKKQLGKYQKLLVLIFIGWFLLFLTHNKSSFLWEAIGPLAYIQFPWRFLSPAVFVFSLASGGFAIAFKKPKAIFPVLLLVTLIIFNFSFFREDLWFNYKDKDLLSGDNWEQQTRASIGDYWPNFGKEIPIDSAKEGIEQGVLVEKRSNRITYKLNIKKEAEISFPINYFPGWEINIDGKNVSTYPMEGLITTIVPSGEHAISLSFRNTNIRTIGNLLSTLSLAVWVFLFNKAKIIKRRK